MSEPLSTDLVALLLAAAVWLGAVFGPGRLNNVMAIAIIGSLAALVVRLGGRRRLAGVAGWLAGLLMLSTFVSNRAASQYQEMAPGPLEGRAVVVADPEPIGAGWLVVLKLPEGERLEAVAFGSAAFTLRGLDVGQEVAVRGRVRPIGERPWLRSRHIVGRAGLDDVVAVGEPNLVYRTVNGLRHTVSDGGRSFGSRRQALYTGLVIGDDRFQHLSQRAQFQAAGLTHLLAVSGQNVAFVLLVVRPLLLVFGFRLRLLTTVVVLLGFVAATRAEPSVLRATASALVATWAAVSGRQRSGIRVLSIGVGALILLDPFLVDVVGFQLSVGASLGILALAPALRLRMALPTVVADPLAVTVAAQLGVSPLLVSYFGPPSIISLPANLAAGWSAGMVMALGLTIGPIAGLAHQAGLSGLASILQWPTGVLVWWIDGVGSVAASLSAPRIGLVQGGLIFAGLGCYAVRPRARRPAMFHNALAVTMWAVAAATGMPESPRQPVELVHGATLWPETNGSGAVLVLSAEASDRVVAAVVEADLDRLSFVVVERGNAKAGRQVSALNEVADVDQVLAPPLHRVRGASRVIEEQVIDTAWGRLLIKPDADGRGLDIAAPATVSEQ